jgi:nicotinate-nucleotide adenylyltransferase
MIERSGAPSVETIVGAPLASADLRVPPARAGMRIGLFGGSFNPPHLGHLHVAETALARLGLDRLWVMVTPGNPLKDRDDLPSLARRIAAARRLMDDPRIVVTGFEAAFGTPYTWRTVERLTAQRPAVRFVWVMGADNLAGFHRWQHWRRIASAVPIAVVDRPEASLTTLHSPAAQALARWRCPETEAGRLAEHRAPAWTFLHAPRIALSSTELRRRGLTV